MQILWKVTGLHQYEPTESGLRRENQLSGNRVMDSKGWEGSPVLSSPIQEFLWFILLKKEVKSGLD